MKSINVVPIFLLLVLLAGTTYADTANTEYLNKVEFDNKSLQISNMLTSFEVVTPNTKSLREAAETGNIKLAFLDKGFELKLKKTDFVSDSSKIIMENKTGIYFVNAPQVDTYSGKVDDIDNSTVSLAIADDVFIGYIRVENKTYIIDQTNQKKDGEVIHVVYDTDALKEYEIKEYNTDQVDLGEENEKQVDNKIKDASMLSSGIENAAVLTYTQIDFLPCYDQDFENNYANPIAEIVSMIGTVNNEYENTNSELKIHSFKRYGSLNVGNGSADALFYYFKPNVAPYLKMTGNDLTMLFYGKDFSDPIFESVIGLGSVYNGNINNAYSVVQMVSAGLLSSYHANYNARCALIAHELGHNFGAVHHRYYSWFEGATLKETCMAATFIGDNNMQVEYSDINRHGNSYSNNILLIAANKTSVSNFRELIEDTDTVGVYNAGTWALWNLSSGYLDLVGFGWSGTKPVVGDWDGDDEIEVGIYDPVNYRFLLRLDSGSYQTIPLGWAGVTPVIGDWNGNGIDEPGVYDNAGTWALWNRNTNSADIVGFGWANTKPVVGDWNNDGATEVGIYNTNGNNFLLKTGSTYQTIGLGWAGVTPVIGDWNGDGTDEPGVYNNAGTWALWNRITNSAYTVGFGWSGTTPVVGHWTGVEGKTGVGIFEASNNRFLLRVDSGLDPVFIDLGWSGVAPVIGHWNEYSTFA